MSSYDNFQDSFNGALRGGSLLQGILHKSEEREFTNKVRRADEWTRGMDGLENKYGSSNPRDWDEIGQALYVDLMNEYPEIAGKRPGGQPHFEKLVPVGDGVAAIVTVDGGEPAPITKRGSSDPDDEVVIVNDVSEQKKVVAGNLRLQRAKMKARMQSANASKIITARENQNNVTNALEGLYQRSQRIQNESNPAADQSGVVPASAAVPQGLSAAAPRVAQAPPQVPADNAGLAAAPANPPAVNPPAVTSPGPPPPSTPKANAPYGRFDTTQKWKSPKAQDITIAAAQANGVDPELMQAVVYHESAGGDINAQSPTGASGLGQMTAIAVKEVNRVYGTNYTREQMKTDPEANADAAAKLLAHELKLHDGNVEQALAAYNGGRTALKKAGGDYTKMRPETAAYPGKVLAFLSGSSNAQAAETQSKSPYAGTPEQDAYRPVPEDVPAIHGDQEPDLSKGTIIRDDAPAEGPREPAKEYTPLQIPKGPKAVEKEIENTPPPASVEEVKEAVKVVQAKKPSQQWTPEERQHLYTLHRLNPSQMPIDTITNAFRTGRIGSRNLKTFQNAAGQVIGVDDNGVETVMGDTPEARRIQQLNRQKSEQDLFNKQLDTRGKLDDQKAKQMALTKATTDFHADQATNIHGGDPERMAKHRDRISVTVDNLGFDVTAPGAATFFGKAAEAQEYLGVTTADWIPHWAGGDETFKDESAGDYSFGMAIINAPGNPHDINDTTTTDGLDEGAQWVHNHYFEPMKEMHPNLSGSQLGQASYLATEMTKMNGGGKPSEEILRQAGALVASNRYDNVAEILAVMKERINFLRK